MKRSWVVCLSVLLMAVVLPSAGFAAKIVIGPDSDYFFWNAGHGEADFGLEHLMGGNVSVWVYDLNGGDVNKPPEVNPGWYDLYYRAKSNVTGPDREFRVKEFDSDTNSANWEPSSFLSGSKGLGFPADDTDYHWYRSQYRAVSLLIPGTYPDPYLAVYYDLDQVATLDKSSLIYNKLDDDRRFEISTFLFGMNPDIGNLFDLLESGEVDQAYVDKAMDALVTPEPATVILLGFGLAGLAGARRKVSMRNRV